MLATYEELDGNKSFEYLLNAPLSNVSFIEHLSDISQHSSISCAKEYLDIICPSMSIENQILAFAKLYGKVSQQEAGRCNFIIKFLFLLNCLNKLNIKIRGNGDLVVTSSKTNRSYALTERGIVIDKHGTIYFVFTNNNANTPEIKTAFITFNLPSEETYNYLELKDLNSELLNARVEMVSYLTTNEKDSILDLNYSSIISNYSKLNQLNSQIIKHLVTETVESVA